MSSPGRNVDSEPARFYGKTLRRRQEPNFCLSERLYPPSLHTPLHAHAKSLFCVVLDGAYYETHCGRTSYCTPATMLFHVRNQDHCEKFEASGGRSLVMEIDSAWLTRAEEYAGVSFDSTAVFEEGPVSLLGARLYKEFLNTDQASCLVIEGLMLEAAGEIARARRPREVRPPRWLEQSRELIRERYMGCLTLAEIAAAVGVHPVHLAQAFRKSYRSTIGDYVRTLRIEFACRELRHQEKSLCDIARQAGFADPSHFARTFKKALGVPPSQYRQAVTGAASLTPPRSAPLDLRS
jgi:AraC family transcriptional regulator